MDLRRAMDDAADRAVGDRPVPGTGPLVERVLRRRAVRTGTTLTSGAAATVLVAVAAVALADAPPGWVAADDLGGWTANRLEIDGELECGVVVPGLGDGEVVDDDGAGADALRLEAEFRAVEYDGTDLVDAGPDLVRGQLLALDASVVNDTGVDLVAADRYGTSPTAWLAQGGVVVGQVEGPVVALGGVYLPSPGAPEPVLALPAGSARNLDHQGYVADCDRSGAPPPAGEYELLVTVRLEDVRAEDSDAEPHDLTLVTGPFALTVLDAPEEWLSPYELSGYPPGLEDVEIAPSGVVLHGGWRGPRVLLPIGHPIAELGVPTAVVVWDGEYCAGTSEPGRWVPNYNTEVRSDTPYLWPTVQDGRVTRIDGALLWTTAPIYVGRGQGTLRDAQEAVPSLALTLPADDAGIEVWTTYDAEHGTTVAIEIDTTQSIARGGAIVNVAVVEGDGYDGPVPVGPAVCDGDGDPAP